MTTQSEFLGRVRSEVRKTAGLFPALPAERPVDPRGAALAIRRELAGRWPQVLERFRVELENVGGVFYRVATTDEVPALVGRIAAERGATLVVAWDRSAMGADLGPELRVEGLEVLACDDQNVEARAGYQSAAAEAHIGITGADLALAETGTLVLISGQGRPRSTSLLPPCHVAIFGRTALVESLEQVGVILEALHADPGAAMSGAMINFITGPSRTADIELTLTRGVHGPKEVHAVFVESL